MGGKPPAPAQTDRKKVAVARPKASARNVQRQANRELHRIHAPIEDRSGGDAAPRIVAVVGPRASGKSSIIRALVKHYSHRNLEQVRGPLTIVTSKTRRLTLVEVPPELPSMVDAAKIADLVLLVINAAEGFEMECFEFLSVAAAHGMPRVLSVLTHLDAIKDTEKIRHTKKLLKDRLASEIVQGAKLFYLTGMRENGAYLKREVQNLARFISIIKYRPISWRNEHPFVLVDRIEDITPAGRTPDEAAADRQLLVHGFVHGSPLRLPTMFHVPGLGDVFVESAVARADPIPPPAATEPDTSNKTGPKRRRTLQQKERLVYAPMSSLDGVFFDPDALYVNIPDSYVRFTPTGKDSILNTEATDVSVASAVHDEEAGLSVGEQMVRALQNPQHAPLQTLSAKAIRLFGDAHPVTWETNLSAASSEDEGAQVGSLGKYGEHARDGRLAATTASDDTDTSAGSETCSSDTSSARAQDAHVYEAGGARDLGRVHSTPERRRPAERMASRSEPCDWPVVPTLDAIRYPTITKAARLRRSASELDRDAVPVDDTRSLGSDQEDSTSSATQGEFFRTAKRNRFATHERGIRIDDESYVSPSPSSSSSSDDEEDATESDSSFLARFAGAARPVDRSSDSSKRPAVRIVNGTSERTPTPCRGVVTSASSDQSFSTETGAVHAENGDAVLSDSDIAHSPSAASAEGSSTDDALTDASSETDASLGPRKRQPALTSALSEWLQQQPDRSKSEADSSEATFGNMSTGDSATSHDSRRVRPPCMAPDIDSDHALTGELSAKALDESEPTILLDANFDQRCFAPGTYLRLELRGVPAAFVSNFDPMRPLILGALPLPMERTRAMMRIRILRHRWFRRLLKTRDPLLFSVGWHRFESVPVFCVEDSTGRHRMLKYTLEHMHCEAMLYGPVVAPGTGVVCFQSLGSERSRDFRIAATGVVCEIDHKFRIVKKLKLVGEPYRIFKNTAFIKGMFNSELEVSKFVGAHLRTPSGLRGVIKKSVRDGPPGTFRATFEDRLLMSDLVFLRTWVPVEAPTYYHAVRNLLEPAPWASNDPHRTYRWMRTARELRTAYQTPLEVKADSVYRPVERLPRRFHPLRIPRALEAALPFASKPKQVEALSERKRRRLERAVPGLAERMPTAATAERKEAQFLQMLRTVRRERESQRAEAQKKRREVHQRQLEKEERQRLAARRVRKKQEYASGAHR
jgi:ribosome biogenesis protein BMS1